jgi:SsrA-binding protein
MNAARKKSNDKKSKSSASDGQSRNIAENRKARYRFEVLEQLECGLQLYGSEVKSLREGKISLDEAYVRIRQGELWLVNADIAEYRQANRWNHDPKRPRKLLVHARQLGKLTSRAQEKGMTLVPLRIYFNARGIVKVMVGVCRGKKLFDKRETQKTRDAKRDLDRAMKARS